MFQWNRKGRKKAPTLEGLHFIGLCSSCCSSEFEAGVFTWLQSPFSPLDITKSYTSYLHCLVSGKHLSRQSFFLLSINKPSLCFYHIIFLNTISRVILEMESSLACHAWSNFSKIWLLQRRDLWTREWLMPSKMPGIL